MKQQTVFIPPRLTSRARVFTGCVVLAFSTAAFGQADRQSSDRRPTESNQQESNANKSFEGKLVTLFHALNGQESSSTDPLQLNRQPGSSTQDRATQPGQPGSTTRPGEATQPGQPGSTTRPGDATQPGTSAQPGTADRSQGQAGLPGQTDASSLLGVGTMSMSQPLALITSDSGESSRAIERSRSSGEGRLSTPATASTIPGTSQRSTTTGSASASSTAEAGDLYVLVFDPSDPESRTAYQMAQSIARSATSGSTGAYGTQATRDPLSSQGTTGTRQSPTGQRELQPTPGALGAAAATDDRQQDRQRDLKRPSEMASGTGEKVKITGRLIESHGMQAIAVQKVERQHEGATASVSTLGGN